jgi:phenylacetic acid degradation protein
MNLTVKDRKYRPTLFVHLSAVVIGDIKIVHECLIAPGVSIRSDFGPVLIEERSNIQDNAVIHVYPDAQALIENDVTIVPRSNNS